MRQVEYPIQKRERCKYHFAMVFVLLLAFALGANGLNADIIWDDELYSVSNMGAFNPPYSPAQIIDSLMTHSPDQVPLFYLLGAGWAQLAGWSQFALRLLSVFFGVLMISWLYRFAADAVNRRTAVVAALLMSTAAFVVLYFHEIRMYTMLMGLGIVHSWLYWRLAHGFRITRWTWILFILTACLLFYTHNFSSVLFAGLGLHHLLFVKKSRRWLHIIIGWGLGAMLFLPYVPFVIDGLSYVSGNSLAASTTEIVEAFAHLLVNGFHFLWLPLVLLFGYALYRKRDPVIVWLLSAALLMILGSLFANWQFQFIKLSRIRYFLLVWPLLAIVFAYGLTSAPRWRVVTILFLLLWCIAGYQLSRSIEIYNYAGVRSAVRTSPPLHRYVDGIKDKTWHKDYLVGFSNAWYVNWDRKHGWSIADYYLEVQLGIDGVFMEAGHEGSTITKRAWEIRRDVRWILDGHPYLLFAYDLESKPPNADIALDIIHEDYVPCKVVVNKPDLLIQRYVHFVMDCNHQPAPMEYGNDIKVFDRAARYDSGSEVLQVLTGWEVADEGLLDEYNVSLQIIASDWQNVRQEDRHLYELPPWDVIELSTEGLPPGDYRLMMILYHRDTGEKVSGLDLASGETGNLLPLLAFTIESPG